MPAKIKTTLYIETIESSPFQIKWGELKKDLPFIPFPGLLIKTDNKMLAVINCVYNADLDSVEVYTRQTDIRLEVANTQIN